MSCMRKNDLSRPFGRFQQLYFFNTYSFAYRDESVYHIIELFCPKYPMKIFCVHEMYKNFIEIIEIWKWNQVCKQF